MPTAPPGRHKEPQPVSVLTRLGALLVWMKLYCYGLVLKRKLNKLGPIAPRGPPKDDVQ
jgi:hypothetical protein